MKNVQCRHNEAAASPWSTGQVPLLLLVRGKVTSPTLSPSLLCLKVSLSLNFPCASSASQWVLPLSRSILYNGLQWCSPPPPDTTDHWCPAVTPWTRNTFAKYFYPHKIVLMPLLQNSEIYSLFFSPFIQYFYGKPMMGSSMFKGL